MILIVAKNPIRPEYADDFAALIASQAFLFFIDLSPIAVMCLVIDHDYVTLVAQFAANAPNHLIGCFGERTCSCDFSRLTTQVVTTQNVFRDLACRHALAFSAPAIERTPRITGAFHGAMPMQTPVATRMPIA